MDKHAKAIPPDYRLQLCYPAAYLYFMVPDFNRSQRWVNDQALDYLDIKSWIVKWKG